MTLIVRRSKNNIVVKSGTCMNINNVGIGGFVKINTSVNINLLPSPGGLDGYFSTYYIITNGNITVTLPPITTDGATGVIEGWKCKIIFHINGFISDSVTILSATGIQVGALELVDATAPHRMVELQSTGSLVFPWSITYFAYNTVVPRLLTVSTVGSAIQKKVTTGNFFSFSANIGGSSVNLNSATLVSIPWDTNSPGIHIDDIYFRLTSANPTRIICLKQALCEVTVLLFAVAAGGATAPTTVRLSENGVPMNNTSVLNSTISLSATFSVIFSTIVLLNYNSYYEIQAGKTTVSAGTNIVNRIITCIHIRVINS